MGRLNILTVWIYQAYVSSFAAGKSTCTHKGHACSSLTVHLNTCLMLAYNQFHMLEGIPEPWLWAWGVRVPIGYGRMRQHHYPVSSVLHHRSLEEEVPGNSWSAGPTRPRSAVPLPLPFRHPRTTTIGQR